MKYDFGDDSLKIGAMMRRCLLLIARHFSPASRYVSIPLLSWPGFSTKSGIRSSF
jgi:hypothetical protein